VIKFQQLNSNFLFLHLFSIWSLKFETLGMKIILLQDVPNIGNKYDIKNVSDGYARNFLIPKCLAKQADNASVKNLDAMREAENRRQEQELKVFQDLAKKVDGQEIEISMKTGEGGTLYGSISGTKIAGALKDKGFNIDKDQIIMEKPIKGIGEFDVIIRFTHNLEAKIKLIVKAGK
jgi:large subunit ribosomal protein L9